MRSRSRTAWLATFLVTTVALGMAVVLAQGAQSAPGTPNPEALKLRNPVRSDAPALAAGKRLYDAQCASCHGLTGLGDGKMGVALTPRPSNLVDPEWKYGDTDGHLFVIIRDGVRQTAMRAYGARMSPTEIWQIVTYVRTLDPRPQASH